MGTTPLLRLIEGLRGLFRSRWQLDADANRAGDVLDVLCNQLEGPWIRDSGATARRVLDSRSTLLLGVLEPEGPAPGRVRVWLDDDVSGLGLRVAEGPGEDWPRGTRLDGLELSGDPFVLCSLLDAEARERLPELLDSAQLEVVESAVQLAFDIREPDWDWLLPRARTALEVVRLLVQAGRDAPARLRLRATSDPARSVRIEAARVLVANRGRRGVPRDVTDELLRCGDPAIVGLAAGRLLGGGRMELTAIAEDRSAPPVTRAAAAICLCDSVPPPSDLLVSCLDRLPTCWPGSRACR